MNAKRGEQLLHLSEYRMQGYTWPMYEGEKTVE